MGRNEGSVARRRVIYIPGYDPFPPRRYRELYRTEGARQAALANYALEVLPRREAQGFGWDLRATIEHAVVETQVEVLVWSDIVQASMGQTIRATYLQLARTAWTYLGSGALFRLMRLRKGPVLAALYPVLALALQLALALGLAALAAALVVRAMPGTSGRGALAQLAIAAVVAAGVTAGVLASFQRLDRRLMAYYLMHDYAHAASRGGAYPPELEARLAAFADRIAAALAEPVDEVLVVGHSSGAYLAVSALADLIRAGRVPVGGPALSLLTLGQVVPMVSFLPKAHRLRADLHDLSRRTELAWVDVTAPGDACCFALCDPVAVSGVAPPDKRWPLVISAAFRRTLRPETFRPLRWRFFRLHFQYLCAFDGLQGKPGEYDYFRITAGPRTLAARFAGRAPSKERIETPASGFTGRGPG